MQKLARYTFLLPAYKARFLKEMLYSIQAQSYKDFNVIVSDDCSPDPIFETVLPFLSDSRFVYRRNEHNIGAERLVAHWNLLLDICNSPYVIIAGDDDLYHPDFLATIDSLVERYSDSNLFRSRLDKIDAAGAVIETEQPFDAFESGASFAVSIFDPTHLHAIGQFVFKTGFLKDTGGFVDFPLAWFSDDATALSASNNGVPTSSIPLFHARNSDLNISSNYDDIQIRLKNTAIIDFYKWFRVFLRKYSDHSSIWKQAQKNSRNYCHDRLMNLYDRLPYSDQIKTLLSFPLFSWTLFKNSVNIWRKKT